ncbi:MAG: c-type cytochrome [Oceanobacter sp.]
MKTLTKLAAVAAFSTATLASAHALKDSDDAIEYRQSVFHLVAAHFGQMGAMVKGKKPFDAAEFQYRAESLDALAKMPLEGFTFPGSDKGHTKAKPEIWTDMDGFKSKLSQFQKDASALAKASKSGDMGSIKPAFGQTAKNCKSCHSDYKNK